MSISANSCVVVNKCYVDSVLRQLSGASLLPLSASLLAETLERLGNIGSKGIVIDEVGTVSLIPGVAAFLKFSQGDKQIVLYFPSLGHLERAFLLSTPKQVTLLSSGWGLQKGYYCALIDILLPLC